MAEIGGRGHRPWPLLNFKALGHRNSIFAIEYHFNVTRWSPSVASSATAVIFNMHSMTFKQKLSYYLIVLLEYNVLLCIVLVKRVQHLLLLLVLLPSLMVVVVMVMEEAVIKRNLRVVMLEQWLL